MGYLPEHEVVQKLLDAGGLTGAEIDTLTEYVTQPSEKWGRELNLEEHAKYMSPQEMLALDFCSAVDAEFAKGGYAAALILRVCSILQNHGL